MKGTEPIKISVLTPLNYLEGRPLGPSTADRSSLEIS